MLTKNTKKPVEEKMNDSIMYYSKLLQKPFSTIEELEAAEAKKHAEEDAKVQKANARRADAQVVEEAFKELNKARKTYKEDLATATDTYRKDLAALKTAFTEDTRDIKEKLEKAENAYATALRTFTEKYPEGYHLTLKDGDFETTISSSRKLSKLDFNWMDEIMDCLFNF